MSKQLIHSLFDTKENIGALILRVPTGIILMAHGAQKLFGWFGGGGLEGTGAWMDSIGLGPGVLMAFLAGAAEFFGGLALVVGFLTRLAGVATAFTMVVAIFTVHIGSGLFVSNGGYEFGLSLLAACAALAVMGGGSLSLDRLVAQKI